jgi:LCP family protein required for cell wall assembly
MSDLRPRSSSRSKTQTIARHGRLKRGNPWGTVAKIVTAAVAVVVVSGVSVAAYAAWDLTNTLKPAVHLVGESSTPLPADIGAIKGGVNMVIAASDTRTDQGGAYGTTDDSSGVGLNDVTMLLHISQDHKSATLISFPRDLIINVPACPNSDGGTTDEQYGVQLNTTLETGGPQNGLACTVLTVESLTGLSIPFAGLVTFDGVVAMSNAVGGVQVCVANGIDDPDTELNLSAGEHTLQGQQAAQFLRTRHGVGDGSDLSRISNQQVFLSALVRNIRSSGTLTNPSKVWALAKATATNVQLSDSLDNLTTLYQIAMALKNIPLSNVLFLQYPVGADPDDPNRVVPDQDTADTIFSAIKSDQPLQLGGTVGEGSVVNTAVPQPSSSATSSPSPSASQAPSSGASSGAAPPVVLPDNVSGQTASTQTCSKGNDDPDDQ